MKCYISLLNSILHIFIILSSLLFVVISFPSEGKPFTTFVRRSLSPKLVCCIGVLLHARIFAMLVFIFILQYCKVVLISVRYFPNRPTSIFAIKATSILYVSLIPILLQTRFFIGLRILVMCVCKAISDRPTVYFLPVFPHTLHNVVIFKTAFSGH